MKAIQVRATGGPEVLELSRVGRDLDMSRFSAKV
jgi:hypothetical protein